MTPSRSFWPVGTKAFVGEKKVCEVTDVAVNREGIQICAHWITQDETQQDIIRSIQKKETVSLRVEFPNHTAIRVCGVIDGKAVVKIDEVPTLTFTVQGEVFHEEPPASEAAV